MTILISKQLALVPNPRRTRRCRTSLRLVQMHHVSSRRLLQRKLIVTQRLIDLQLQDVEFDIVLLLRTGKLNARRIADATIVFVISIASIGRQLALFVVNVLPMRLQVGAAENNLA